MHKQVASFIALGLVATASCGTEANFNTRFAPGFSPPHHAVSVFGVFKDGQMSAGAWDTLAPRISPAIGSAKCTAGYVEGSSAAPNATLWSAVDDYTRSNGPTDVLLTELAPAAEGDLVLVLTVAGRVPEEEKLHPQEETPQKPSMMGGQGRGGGGGMGGGMGAAGMMSHHAPTAAGAKDALELAALLYSVKEKQSVAQVTLEYTGHSYDDAMAKFTLKLRQTLPAASCTGWTWDGKVDVERVRNLGGS
jgi:hypothetical protein